jgi:predicted tellurium resistance membrane protein TerC
MESLQVLLADPATWPALLTLVVMEVVLGIDNLIFVSVLTHRLPPAQQGRARALGLGGALVLRIALLFTLSSLTSLKDPVLTVLRHGLSWRDLILIGGGLFLVYKSTSEIHQATDDAGSAGPVGPPLGFGAALAQILLLDAVFSVDSILTAVGMTDELPIMVVAVVTAVALMFVASGPISAFIHAHPSVVMLALAFLLMIGMVLVAEGFGAHIEKGYVYAAMTFAGFVEALQLFRRRAAA